MGKQTAQAKKVYSVAEESFEWEVYTNYIISWVACEG